jgi:hypothetical protein
MIDAPKHPYGLLQMLVLEGTISISTAARIQEKAHLSWRPIGQILREQGHLSVEQVIRLLQLQAEEPHLLLGELAVRERMCREKHVQEALRIQRETSPHVIERLLDEEGCDPERLCRALVRYVRQLEARVAELPTPA